MVSHVEENQLVGTRVGQLLATDPDANSSLTFRFVDGNGSENNSLFIIDENATLRTTTTFDYETADHNYSIRVQVSDEHNFSLDQSFDINLLNIIEDNDNDGMEDYYDPDDDNDGFSDHAEITYGSDPLDANSVANQSPDFIDLNGSHVEENQLVGTRVGQLLATDPDANSSLSFLFVDGNGSVNNDLFIIDENVTLRTTTTFDYETADHNYSIRVQVSDEHNFSLEQSFDINLLNIIEDNDNDEIEDYYDPDDDNDGFSDQAEITYGSDPLDANSVANQSPNFIDFNGSHVEENQLVGTRVGQLLAKDPDANSSLTFRIVDGHGSVNNALFIIDENATLRTTTIFDYETDDHNYSIRIEVSDEHNFSLEQSFDINLLNIIEDNDNDGMEDYYDPDDDNDGFSDEAEIAFGSDPFDKESKINRPPTGMEIMDLNFSENMPTGSLIGKVLASDPDANESLKYSNLTKDENGTKELFFLQEDGHLYTSYIFDFETNESVYSLTFRVTDRYGETLDKTFEIELENIIEDIDNDGVEDYYDPDIDGDGFANELEIKDGTDPLDDQSHPRYPVLSLESGRIDSDTRSITLSATVQHDGDGILEDIGFILSPALETDSEGSIRISENDWTTFEWVDSFKILEGVNQYTFELVIQESPFDKTLYFRAWAENSAGVGMSSVKKLQLQISELPWVNDLTEETGGWFSSSWFGLFKPYPNQWIYHTGLGWIYASSTEDESVWIWREGQGWLWTNQQTWPFLWSDQTGNWLYLIRGKLGPPIFFDYSQNSYISDTVE